MKPIPSLLLLTATGTLLASAPPLYAQKVMMTDPTGKPLASTPFNLTGDYVTGVLPPAHLGTGTPTTATVLRGDGSWAGTTATGNTLAATGSLLQGDGAGNAVAVGSSAILKLVFQARAELFQSGQSLPANLLPPGSGYYGLASGSVNADGTITVPANGNVRWSLPGDAGGIPLFAYVVATTEQPAGALQIDAGSTNAQSNPAPSVYRGTFASRNDFVWPLYIRNLTSAPITIFYPAVCYTDNGILLMQSFADYVPVAAPPVADLDFTKFASADRTSRYLAEKQTTLAVDSVTGSAGNAGTRYSPKLSLNQTLAGDSILGLYRGSLFRDSVPLSSFSSPHGIVIQDLSFGARTNLPAISALDPVPNGSVTANGDGTYSYTWTAQDGTVANDGYANVYVVEINSATEASTPVASRRRMIDLSGQSAVTSVPGSVYISSPGAGHWTAWFRPSDSLAPGSGSYRYEVISRFIPVGYPTQAVGDTALSGLELVGGSNGYGSLSAPTGTVADRLVLLHCSTHNAVLGGGTLQRSVFYEMGDASGIQLAWYTNLAAGLSWDTRQCLFYANVGDRAADCLISHANSNFDRGDISDTAFLGARWSDGGLRGTAMDYNSTSNGTVNRVYVQGIAQAFGFSFPLAGEIKNSVFRSINLNRIPANFHDNVVLAESASVPGGTANYPYACYLQQTGASATHNLFWARGLVSAASGSDNAVYGIGVYPGVTGATVQRNIIVLNPASTWTDASTYANLPAGAPTGFSFDYNLIVNLTPNGFATNGANGNTSTFAQWQSSTGLDAHSLYVDLSADPRGIKALFVDPLNGDFRWAQTEVARRCAAYCRANNVGPATVISRWPLVPTVDDAVRMLTEL